jgi:hypothetical protein
MPEPVPCGWPWAITVPQAISIAVGAALIAAVNYRIPFIALIALIPLNPLIPLILLLVTAAVTALAAVQAASRREQDAGQTTALASQHADSMPRESAGTLGPRSGA